MTGPGRYGSNDVSRSGGGNAAARGGVLIAIAVVVGFVLLWQGFGNSGSSSSAPSDGADAPDTTTSVDAGDGSDGGDGGDGGETPDPGDTTTTAPGTEPTVSVAPSIPPGEVKVAVGNGTGEAGLAGSRAEVLSSAGYITSPVNALSTEISGVYYTQGYDGHALAIAGLLGGGAAQVQFSADPLALFDPSVTAEIADHHVFVVLGTDRVLG
jgi:hypothetical protein